MPSRNRDQSTPNPRGPIVCPGHLDVIFTTTFRSDRVSTWPISPPQAQSLSASPQTTTPLPHQTLIPLVHRIHNYRGNNNNSLMPHLDPWRTKPRTVPHYLGVPLMRLDKPSYPVLTALTLKQMAGLPHKTIFHTLTTEPQGTHQRVGSFCIIKS
jgi:hypothetical protein